MTDLVAILTAAGLHVVDHRVNPRPGPAFAPVGIINHHTATTGPALSTTMKGRADLAGPLCNINLTRDGVANVVCDGRANHAGSGSSRVLDDVRHDRPVTQDAAERHLADDTDGNSLFIGIEVDNDGVGEDLPKVQLAALVSINAALCEHFGWSEHRCIHHRQWTRRKQDMHWRGDLPALVGPLLHHTTPTTEEPELTDAEIMRLTDAVASEVMKRLTAAEDPNDAGGRIKRATHAAEAAAAKLGVK